MKKSGTIVLFLLCVMLFLNPASVLAQNAEENQSSFRDDIEQVFIVTAILGIFVGALAFGLLLYMLLKYRESNQQPRKDIKKPLRLELSWTIMATVIVGILLVVSLPVAHDIVSEPTADYEVINVTGFQFAWIFEYENGTQIFSFQGPLVLEIQTLYLLNLTSIDVIHSFFVYDLAFKVDAIPGQYTQFKLVIDDPGEYQVLCAEFCGPGHHSMEATILAIE